MVPFALSLLALPVLATAADEEALRFGFAKRLLTPVLGDRPVYMAGFGSDRRAAGVHDDLWARAVAVSDGHQRVVVVSVDLIVADGKLRKVSLPGGTPVTICESADHRGGSWGPEDVIVWASDEGLFRVSAAVGEPELLATVDRDNC